MRKFTKILLTVLSSVILAAIVLPVLLMVLLNLETVQNFVVRRAGTAISERIGTKVSIGSIRIRGYNRLVAGDFFVQDFQGDTLLYAQTLSANISKSALLRRNIIIGDVVLDNARIYLHQPADGELNLSEVLNNIPGSDRQRKNGRSSSILLRDVYISNSVFRYWTERPTRRGTQRQAGVTPGSINFDDMRLNDLTLGAHNLRIGDEITMRLYDLSFTEQSGFRLELIEARKFTLGDGVLNFNKLRIVTNDTDLALPLLELRGMSWKDFSDFSNKVRFKATIDYSTLHSNTLAYFAPALQGFGIPLIGLSLSMNGPLVDFSGKITSADVFGTRFAIDYAVTELMPESAKANYELDIRELRSNAASIEKIMSCLSPSPPDSTLMSILSSAGNISLSGTVDGKLSAFRTSADITTDAGAVSLSGAVRRPVGEGVSFSGEFGLDGVEGGRLLGEELLGEVSMAGSAELTVGGGNLMVKTNTFISELDFNGYVYHRLGFNGSIEDKKINGAFTADDPALRMNLRGSADLGAETPSYDLDIDLVKADLAAMKINKADSVSVVSGGIVARASGSTLDDLNGTIAVTGLEYVTHADSIKVESITLFAENGPQSKHLSLTSPYAAAEFNSTMSYGDVSHFLLNIPYIYMPSLAPRLSGGERETRPLPENTGAYSSFSLDVKESDELVRVFLPGLSLAKGTKLDFRFNPGTERLHIEAASDYVEYEDYFVTRLQFTGDNHNPQDSLRINFTTEEIFFPGFVVPTTELTVTAKSDRIHIDAAISNAETNVSAQLDLAAALSRSDEGRLTVKGNFNPSRLFAGGEQWGVASSDITYSGSRIDISDFRIRNEKQELRIYGTASDSRSDTLRVRLTGLSLGLIAGYAQKAGYTPHGYLTGYADLASALKRPLISAEVNMEEIGVNGYTAPPLRFTSVWDFENERARLVLTNTLSGERILSGYYRPGDGTLQAQADIAGLPLTLAGPLLPEIVADTEGTADIHVTARRSPGRPPVFDGRLDLHGLTTTVVFTRATYTIPEATLSIADNRVTLPAVTLSDSQNGTARLEGWLDLNNFSTPSYEVRLQPARLLAVNTSIRDNDNFYGRVFASGNVNLRGDRLGVNINAAVRTDDGSSISVPLNSASVSGTDFITYRPKRPAIDTLDYLAVKKQNYLRARQEKKGTGSRTELNIAASLNVTPGTVLQLVVDPIRNDALEVRGNATLNVNINPRTNDLSVSGTYTITEGTYLFNFQNIITNKLFEIEPGSTIRLSGNPMDAILDITATYSLRTSLAPLLNFDGDTGGTGVAERFQTRVPVVCIIRIGNRLSRPEILFDVEVQTADAELQAIANSALNTQDNKTMQFIWLVAFNSFVPESLGATQVSGASLGFDFVSNQINNLIATLTDDTSFNFRYRRQDGINSDEVDFGFTKKLLDGRLIIEYEGNYDSGYESKVYKDIPLSNNIYVTGLLNESGSLRLTAFTRTVTRYEFQGLQEIGLGLYLKEDFNRFSEVLERMRGRSAIRKQRRAERKEAKLRRSEGYEVPAPEQDEPAAEEEPQSGNSLYIYAFPDIIPGNGTVTVRSKSEKRPPELF